MAANRVGRRMNKSCSNQSPSRASADRDAAQNLQRRHIRVTVKYNRKELQRRMEVEKWIDCELEKLYKGREEDMPAEVNIDELLDLRTDEERTERLQVFVCELLFKLHGLQKHEDLHNNGIDLPQLHIYPTRPGSADREVLH
uniref:Protein phosphatase 1, regulatory (inhibitor) subunit 14Ab n=1 Tax=Gasterosteus aculeatus aculeatus TaxID=481459 RepID=A0AAQ4R6H9_GASAC